MEEEAPSDGQIRPEAVVEVQLGVPVGQLRAAPVRLGAGAPRAFLAVHCADFAVDPYVEMFFFPTDTLKLTLLAEDGRLLWRRDLGRGVVPGTWFCPVLPFDLDSDGVDEIWFVNNLDPKHPLGLTSYRLERLDARTGQTTGQWRWPNLGGNQSLSHTFRNFIVGGRVKDAPVLVTAQGTYGDMFFQAWRPDMSPRWELTVRRDEPGARGSHMCPITDLDQDSTEELMWGERCIGLDSGEELFCADRDSYRGHSDVVQPVLDRSTNSWFLYTCREGDARASPRVALFDSRGRRVWGQVDRGHMDMGWVARIGENARHVAMAIRIGKKTMGPDGLFHEGVEEFTFDALTGEPRPLPFRVYRTVPVDLNGDGFHELVRGGRGRDCEVLDRTGKIVARVSGAVAMASKLLDLPGEQVLTYGPDGVLWLWADRAAVDTEAARARYAHPFYAANQRLTATGSNRTALGGL